MASIYTYKNEEVLVDNEDMEFLSQFKWHLNNSGYPVSSSYQRRGLGILLMHKLLVPAVGLNERDHINGNRCDNRRKNLEEVPRAVNLRRRPTHPMTGIAFNSSGRYVARLHQREAGKKLKNINLGSYKTLDLAILARVIAEIRYWGEPTQRMP